MAQLRVEGLSDEITAEVRRTLRSPGYGHPVMQEVAQGTGPCRACFQLFHVGVEERLLFTYRPPGSEGTLGAPGPVFIHARECTRYSDDVFPATLHALPLLIEARAHGNRILHARHVEGASMDDAQAAMLEDPAVDYLHVRHGVAGCYIARVDRVSPSRPSAPPGPVDLSVPMGDRG